MLYIDIFNGITEAEVGPYPNYIEFINFHEMHVANVKFVWDSNSVNPGWNFTSPYSQSIIDIFDITIST